MDLFSVILCGYRRFKKQTQLRTNGKIIALIGKNEAGKSSMLDALMSLQDSEPLDARDISRGLQSINTKITAKFLLSREETQFAGIPYPSWLLVQKTAAGKRTYDFQPSAPDRETTHREELFADLSAIEGNSFLSEAVHADDEGLLNRALANVRSLVDSPPDAATSLIDQIKEDGNALEEILGALKTPFEIGNQYNRVVSLELEDSPYRKAINAVYPNIPSFLEFDEEERNLESEYSLAELKSDSAPIALRNLLAVAGVDLAAVLKLVDEGNSADLTTIEHRANDLLKEKFGEAWGQSGVRIALRFTATLIEIQVANEAKEFSALAERSDGLRQFVALHAFANQHDAKSSILLIDEAEQRLHYDAQADLVQMLAQQTLSNKVIYTTHSAGCLPEDLGNGVRLIEVSDDPSASLVVNKFWANSGEGFTPLLIGLGASTLAFFPTRRSVMVEGPADMLLYPTMFREVLSRDALGYQFVPGLSTDGPALAAVGKVSSARTIFIHDSDAGGLEIAQKLVSSGVNSEHVLALKNSNKSAVELEDFIEPSLLVRAANQILQLYHKEAAPVMPGDLSLKLRINSLEDIYRARTGEPLSKIELAYAVLDFWRDEPGLKIVDAKRAGALAKLANKVDVIFGGPVTLRNERK